MVKYPNVVEKLDSISKFSYADATVTSGLNIWTIYAQRAVSERSAFRNSVETNALTNNLLQMPDDSVGFCVCSFMKSVYIFGGYIRTDGGALRTCLKYDTRNSSWSNISDMKNYRNHAACTMFEGKIVVSGGKLMKLMN